MVCTTAYTLSRWFCGWSAACMLLLLLVFGQAAASPPRPSSPLGPPIGETTPSVPKKPKPEPRIPASTTTPRTPPRKPLGGLGQPIGGADQPISNPVNSGNGRTPSFGDGDESNGIEMSLWPEDMETANGLLQWRVNIVRYSPRVSSQYRTPVRPDGFVTGVGSVSATMVLTQNGTCVSVLSIGGMPMTQIEVACSRGPGLMFRIGKPLHRSEERRVGKECW